MDVDDEDEKEVSSFKCNNSNIDASEGVEQTDDEIVSRDNQRTLEVYLDESSDAPENKEIKSNVKQKGK